MGRLAWLHQLASSAVFAATKIYLFCDSFPLLLFFLMILMHVPWFLLRSGEVGQGLATSRMFGDVIS
jgi:hypothetical protein